MIFEPIGLRKGFEEYLLEMTLSTQHDGSAAMGNMPAEHIGDVIEAWLVGLEREISPALPRALGWFDKAIREDEDFGTSRAYHRLTLLWAKAMGSWLHTGKSDSGDWEAVRTQSLAVKTDSDVFSPEMIAVEWLDDHMAFCILAGQWHSGIEEYEKIHGESPAWQHMPVPRDFGYAYCHYRASAGIHAAQVFEAGRRMLAANLQGEWLGRGQKIRAATWLEIVYWDRDRLLTPLQTILRAYDDMPKVTRPQFAHTS